MPFVRRPDVIEYLRNLRTLRARFDELGDFSPTSVCCIPKPYNTFYLTRDAADWCHELDLERRQRTNARGPRFAGWHDLKLFALHLRELNSFYAMVPGLWGSFASPRASNVPIPTIYTYLSGHSRYEPALEHRLSATFAEVDLIGITLATILRTVRNSVFEQQSHDIKV